MARPIYPQAHVARLPVAVTNRKSATLVARRMGYLAVQIFFHRRPWQGLEVRFFKANDDGTKGAAVGEMQVTSSTGLAALDFMVPADEYICEIEHQEPALITSVNEITEAYTLVLPIGRPYFDALHQREFDPTIAPTHDEPASAEG